jgi:radical SAM superfamily enzyme YgiQ (UPF0313 family)
MHYVGNIIRPPSEANSIILQVTIGCSHNKCTFCPTYKGVKFGIKSDEIILSDLDYAAKHFSYKKRLFITDGDALILPQKKLIWLFDKINEKLPWLERIGIYANAKALKRKQLEDLIELKKRKLGIIYYGIESGDDETLKFIKKGVSSDELITEGKKVKDAGIILSVTVLLGIAPNGKFLQHAVNTGVLLSKLDPDYVGALTVIVVPGTELYELQKRGEWSLISQKELLMELRNMIYSTNLSNGYFMSNHASNYVPLKIKMPEEKENALKIIDLALEGEIPLREEWMRAL